MINIAICDDDSFQLEMLSDILRDFQNRSSEEVSVTEFSSGIELLNTVKNADIFDIYVLDIIMDGISGYDVAMKLFVNHYKGKIIFTTSSTDYLLASYDVRAFYYLVKPLDRNKLFSVLDMAVEDIKKHSSAVSELAVSPVLSVKTYDGTVNLAYSDIMYVNLSDKRLVYHLSGGKTLKSNTIHVSFSQSTEPLAEYGFVRINVSTIINPRFADTLDETSVLLTDGTMLYPSRACYTAAKNALADYRLKKR